MSGSVRALRSPAPRTTVRELQRARIIAATLRAIEAHGVIPVNAGVLIDTARISRKTFYEIFADREECLLAVFEQAVATARARARAAYAIESTWRAGMRAATFALLDEMEREPAIARFVVVEAFVAGPRLIETRAKVLSELANVIDRGRSQAASRDPSSLTAQATAGGLAAVLYARLLTRERLQLVELLGPFMSMIVLPYLGPAAARAELSKPAPAAPVRGPGQTAAETNGHSLSHLGIRLTYRTMRVLHAIAEHPDASNSTIAATADVVDAGQMSKLLKRLHGYGLIENARPNQGDPNAWRLTAQGAQLERTTRVR
jgi:AcrR family transcriptional regulator